MHMSTGARCGYKKTLDPLKLELKPPVNPWKWVLEQNLVLLTVQPPPPNSYKTVYLLTVSFSECFS